MSLREQPLRKEAVVSLSSTDQQLIDDMFIAVKHGDVAAVTRYFTTNVKAGALLSKHKDSVFGNMSIHYAAVNGHIDIVKLLLKCGADVNSRNNYGWTPLMLAAFHNNLSMVKFLASVNTININSSNDFGLSALQIAIYQRNIPILRFLLESGAKVNQGTSVTPLMMACHVGKTSLVNIILQHGGETNAQSRLNGWTPMMYAANSTSTCHISKLLVEHGADTDVKTVTGQTAFDIASLKLHDEVIMYLKTLVRTKVENSQSKNVTQPQLEVARHKIFDALTNEDYGSVKSIITNDPHCVFERDPSDGMTPLMLSCIKGQLDLVKLLVSTNAPLNQKDDIEWTALKHAAYYNRPQIVDFLISKGARLFLEPSIQQNPQQIDTELKNLSTDLDILEMLKNALTFNQEFDDDNVTSQSCDAIFTTQTSRKSSVQSEDKLSWFSKLLSKSKWKKSDSDVSLASKPDVRTIPKMSSKKANKSKTLALDREDLKILSNDVMNNSWGKYDTVKSKSSSRNGNEGSNQSTSYSTHSDPGHLFVFVGSSSTKDSMASQKQDLAKNTFELVRTPSNLDEKKVVITDPSQYTPFDSIMGANPSNIVIPPSENHTGHTRSLSATSRRSYHLREKSSGSTHSDASAENDRKITLASMASEANDLSTFLHVLEFDAYLQLFTQKKIVNISDLSGLTDSDLLAMGIQKLTHRQLLILAIQSWKAEQQVKNVMNVQDQVREFINTPTVSSTYTSYRSMGKVDDETVDHSPFNSSTNTSSTRHSGINISNNSYLNSPAVANSMMHTVAFDSFSRTPVSVVNSYKSIANTAPAAYFRGGSNKTSTNNIMLSNTNTNSNTMGKITDKYEMIAEMKRKKQLETRRGTDASDESSKKI